MNAPSVGAYENPAEDALKLLDRFYASWATREPAAVAACFHEDGVFEDLTLGTRHAGRDALRAFAADVFAALAHMEMERVSGFGGLHAAAAHWRLRANKADATAPNGVVPLVIEGLDLCELDGGELVRVKHSWDLRQWK